MILEFEDEKRLLDDATRELMQTCSQAAQKAEGVTLPLSVFIRVVDDDEIRAINREQRGKDASTDVLSFPTVNYPKGKTAGACEGLLREEFDPDVDACAIGDIVISDGSRARTGGGIRPQRAARMRLSAHTRAVSPDGVRSHDRRGQARDARDGRKSACLHWADQRGVTNMTDEKLLELALDARKNAYVPYSHFPVGAALECEDGAVFTGCNIENSSYGLTNCAERTAAFKAVSEGHRRFKRIVIAGRSDDYCYPCGACRQVLYEFAPGLEVLVTWDGHVERAPLSELLPHGFGPSSLGK